MGVLVSKPWASRATGQPSEERTRTSRRETSREARAGPRTGRKRLACDSQDDKCRTPSLPAAPSAAETEQQVVSAGEREGLIARIRQIRRVTEPSSARGRPSATREDEAELRSLEGRVAHLEQLVQGLQDSVHRESRRQGDRIADLEARTQPAELAKTLSEDARNRGI